MIADYESFIADKAQWQHECGFKNVALPDFLFDFQKYLTEWALIKGRSAIFADCGLGKTAMQLAWADQVIKKENKPVLLLTPLAVSKQTIDESEKFGIEAKRSRDGSMDSTKCVWVTNYQQMHKFNPRDFAAVVCDESSCIKNFKSATKAIVTEFMRVIPYRLLCTATAAPNDFWELGTSSEALGLLGFRDMVTTFFRQETTKDRLGWGRTKYRFRGHAEQPFWAWVCSWARSVRLPSDLGFSDDGYLLPPVDQQEYIVSSDTIREGHLFHIPATNLQEERQERRNSITERCQKICEIVESHDGASVAWCELNDEGDMLERMIPEARQIKGSMKDEDKEELFEAFSNGQLARLILKPKIGAWGLNWQHCNNVAMLPSHSYEQYYQAISRCQRFGQKKQVKVSLVVSEGEAGLLRNLQRKQKQAETMFRSIVEHMKDAMHLTTSDYFPEQEQIPKWLS